MLERAPRPTDSFASIRNEALQDKRLDLKSIGLLVNMLSRPPGWRISSERLTQEVKNGRDSVRSALKELEQYGYIKRARKRTSDGRWEWTHYVTDDPDQTIDGFSGDG